MNARAFINSLTEEVLDIQEYNDTSGISAQLDELSDAIAALKKVTTVDDVGMLVASPNSDRLIGLLFGISPKRIKIRNLGSTIATQIGQWRDWLPVEDITSVMAGLLLAEAQASRAQRRRRKFSEIVQSKLASYVDQYNSPYLLKTSYRINTGASSRLYDYVILSENEPVVAVVGIFQTTGGGRQQYVFTDLPGLQSSLERAGVALLVIADGPGFKSMASTVERAMLRLRNVVNLRQFDENAIDDVVKAGQLLRQQSEIEAVRVPDEVLDSIATVALQAGRAITPKLLGISPEATGDYLIRFQAAHSTYDLLRPEPHRIASAAETKVRDINSVFEGIDPNRDTDPVDIARILAEKLGYALHSHEAENGFVLTGLSMKDVQLRLPDPVPVFLPTQPYGHSRNELFEAFDIALSKGKTIARLAVFIDAVDPDLSRTIARKFADQQRSQIAVLDRDDVIEILLKTKTAAQQYLVDSIVREVDLSLVSPFVSEGPTPYRMFFGREHEIRRIVEQVENHSFAIIGGRKVGKTSVLQRLRDILPETRPVIYIDCQAHPDRQDFLDYLISLTPSTHQISSSANVVQAERIIRAFVESQFGNLHGVILLDEVDDLFDADSKSVDFPHVLSRALRAISQASSASIIATGERALFELTTDPTSPHWNFCTPVIIGSLSDDAARRLLREPLEVLGVDIARDALNIAVERTAQHPNLLQFLGTQIVDALATRSSEGAELKVDSNLIGDLISRPNFRNRYVTTFWSQAEPLEKLISFVLSTDIPKTAKEIHNELISKNLLIQGSDVLKSLTFLQLYGIAVQANDGYLYASSAHSAYFGPLANSLLAEQWIEELR